MAIDVISKPIYQILSELTQELRVEVALPLAMKDLVRLRLKEAVAQRALFEQRYAMTFAKFAQEWETVVSRMVIPTMSNRDYWEWEAAVTDEARLLGIGLGRCHRHAEFQTRFSWLPSKLRDL